MSPALAEGDHILVDERAYKTTPPRPGEVVVALHPFIRNTILVKRVAAIDETGRITLSSDNLAEGTDSRSFGALRPERILGRVVARVA